MSIDRDAFDRLLGELRPKLHRYWARMTGSVIDGEDVLQDALIKAIEAVDKTVANPEAWLFRIAHNAALDHLRHRARQEARHADEDPDMIVDPVTPAEDRLAPPGAPRFSCWPLAATARQRAGAPRGRTPRARRPPPPPAPPAPARTVAGAGQRA